MDEPTRFARVLLQFMEATQPPPFDRAVLKDWMIKRSRTITGAPDDVAQTPTGTEPLAPETGPPTSPTTDGG